MNNEPQHPHWQRLSKVFFGSRKMADEGLFTYAVMQKIRALDAAQENVTWHHFLRWAVPLLGAGAASLVLAVRAPASLPNDPLPPMLEDFR